MKCQSEIFQKLKKLNFLTNWTKSKREKFKFQKKMSQFINMIKNSMKFKVIKMPLKSWDMSEKLWLISQLILTIKLNQLKKIFKISKIKLKKFTINLEILITLNFCKKLLNWNNKFMPFGTKLNNWKNNTKPKSLNMNKNKKKLNILNGQRILRLKRLKLGKLKNKKERNKNLEKKKDKRRVTRNQSNKVRKSKDKKLKKKNQLSKEKESIETKNKLMLVHSWFNIVRI